MANVEKKQTPAKKKRQEFIDNQNQNVEDFFHKISPEETKKKKFCNICGKELNMDDYWRNYSYSNAGRLNEDGYFCCSCCKNCSQNLFDYHYAFDKNLEVAMEKTCIDINMYWDIEKLKEAKKIYEHNKRKLHILSEYVGAVGRSGIESLGLTYWSSPIVQQRENVKITDKNESNSNNTDLIISEEKRGGWDTPYDWDKEDAENRKKIIRLYRYDPFDGESEKEKPVLYADLAGMIDEAMEEDLIKLKAALEIVRSFSKLERLRQKSMFLEKAKTPDMQAIKSISELCKAEMKTITDFSNNNGFSARYAQNKERGAGSLSGVMKAMNEKLYENGLLNLYDIETSKSIEQAAEASWKAITSQLPIGENERYLIIQDQRTKIITLEKKFKRVEEELRLARIEVEKMKLEKKKYESERNMI